MKHNIDFDRVDQYGPQHVHVALSLSPEQLEREELRSGLEVELDLNAEKGDVDGEYLLEGDMSYHGELFCSRCLEPFPFANKSTLSLRYRPRPTDLTSPEAEIEMTDQELDLDFYDERTLPLEMIAQEQIQLSLPMKPLCEEACQGLCPQCGANLRRRECNCSEQVTDARWNTLREFRELLARKKEN